MSWPLHIDQRYVHEYDGRISSYFAQMMWVLVSIDILHPSHNSQQTLNSSSNQAEDIWPKSSQAVTSTAPKTTDTGSSFWWIHQPRDSGDPDMSHEQRRPSESSIIDLNFWLQQQHCYTLTYGQTRCWSAARGRLTVTPGGPLVKVFQSSEGGFFETNVSTHYVILNITQRLMEISGRTFWGNDNHGIWHNLHWLQPPVDPPFLP
jgi:hypothetical protein